MEMKLEHVECPICGPSRTTIWWLDSKHTSYVRCKTCKTIYTSPRLSQNHRHAQIDEVWDFSPKVLSFETGRLPALRQEAEYIQSFIHEGRLLDVGCSSGKFFDFFPQPAWERYGVDISASSASYAAQMYGAQVFAGTLRDARWPSKFFNLVSMFGVLYYLDDPAAEIKEVERILEPHGVLVIEIPGQAYTLFRSRGIMPLLLDGCWCRMHSESHYTYWFSPKGLQQLLKKSGFEPVTWQIIPNPIYSNRFFNFLSSSYDRLYSCLVGHSMSILNWAPKYICLARKG
jgi:SAM-dependent methyltransferase